MPESILTILKFCFLALLYLFLARVVRVVYAEMGGRSSRLAPAATPPKRRRGLRRRGAPALKILEPPSAKGRTFPIDGELTVGRASACQISLPEDTYASQVHARVYLRDGEVYVEDLGSTNGTYLNRAKVTYPTALKRGDRLQIGKTVMEVVR